MEGVVDRPHQSIICDVAVGVDADIAEHPLDLFQVCLGMSACSEQCEWAVRSMAKRYEQIKGRRRVGGSDVANAYDERVEQVLLVWYHEVAHRMSVP